MFFFAEQNGINPALGDCIFVRLRTLGGVSSPGIIGRMPMPRHCLSRNPPCLHAFAAEQ
jgi:hypothetical protein